MTDFPQMRAKFPPVAAGCAGFGLLLWLLLPAGVTVMNDDFGYLGSVLETVRRGRPWTDDWLEPWSASLATICAFVWRLTGSFHVATQGVQALLGAVGVGGAYMLFRSMDLSRGRSLCLAGLLLTVPTVLWKQVEFTALVLYLPCLLWAIWAALQGRWRLFFVAWLLAFASRQSALVWLALPAWACLHGLFSGAAQTRVWRAPAWVLGGAVPVVLLLCLGMNQSNAQAVLTAHSWQRMELSYTVRNAGFGVVVWLVAAGWGALLQAVWAPGRSVAQVGPRRVLTVLAAVTGAAVLSASYFPIYLEHDGYAGVMGRLYVSVALAAGVAGWLLAPGTIRPGLALAGLGALAPLALRTNTWDYYYLDIALFGLAAAHMPAVVREPPPARSPAPWLGWLVLGMAAAGHLQFAWDLKCHVDREYAVNVLTERALRADLLPITDIGHASYGFQGWQLHPHYTAHEGRGSMDTGAFTRYLRRGATSVHVSPMRFWRDSRTLLGKKDLEESRLVASEVFRVGWLWYQRVSIVRSVSAEIGPAGIPQPNPALSRRVLPLDDREWRATLP